MLPDFRVRQRDYLLEISRALTKELDLDKLLERILHLRCLRLQQKRLHQNLLEQVMLVCSKKVH